MMLMMMMMMLMLGLLFALAEKQGGLQKQLLKILFLFFRAFDLEHGYVLHRRNLI